MTVLALLKIWVKKIRCLSNGIGQYLCSSLFSMASEEKNICEKTEKRTANITLKVDTKMTAFLKSCLQVSYFSRKN